MVVTSTNAPKSAGTSKAVGSETYKGLALAIIEFLTTSLANGTVSKDDTESIEIASSCIAEAFGVDAKDKSAVEEALHGQTLLSIYDTFNRLHATKSSSATAATATTTTDVNAEALKAKGNTAMAEKNFSAAVDFYTQALDISPINPIYLSNRAAAYSGMNMHDKAADDASAAVTADPSYAKGWSRLGLAKFALGEYKESMEAYKSGIEAEGNGGSDAMIKGYETAKRRLEDDTTRTIPNGGGGGGAGGFDFSSLMSAMTGGGNGGSNNGDSDTGNPMSFVNKMMQNPMMQQMAQKFMSDPQAVNSLMNNPALKETFGSSDATSRGSDSTGSGLPSMESISQLMNDPSIKEMARKLFQSPGGGPAGKDNGGNK